MWWNAKAQFKTNYPQRLNNAYSLSYLITVALISADNLQGKNQAGLELRLVEGSIIMQAFFAFL
jgi:hypothetical protein